MYIFLKLLKKFKDLLIFLNPNCESLLSHLYVHEIYVRIINNIRWLQSWIFSAFTFPQKSFPDILSLTLPILYSLFIGLLGSFPWKLVVYRVSIDRCLNIKQFESFLCLFLLKTYTRKTIPDFVMRMLVALGQECMRCFC